MRSSPAEPSTPAAAEGGHGGDRGMSYIELLLALAVAAVVMGLAAPLGAHVRDADAAGAAAQFMASRFRAARQHAAVASASTAIVFSQRDGDGPWLFDVCVDDNGNGVRRTEIAGGTDECPEQALDLARMFRGVRVAVDPALPGPDGDAGTADPVRFGSSDMASFSPSGSGTGGTVFLRSSTGLQYAVRVGNMTGRTRVLRFDPGRRVWGPA